MEFSAGGSLEVEGVGGEGLERLGQVPLGDRPVAHRHLHVDSRKSTPPQNRHL